MTDTQPASRELTKVSVNMIPRAMDALDAAAERNRESRTDAINRAVQLYDVITAALTQGTLLLLRHEDGTIERMTIL